MKVAAVLLVLAGMPFIGSVLGWALIGGGVALWFKAQIKELEGE